MFYTVLHCVTGDVISAITNGQSHIPYRNNPLTQFMSDSVGGNAKTLMIVAVSAEPSNASETDQSLQYATRVKRVKQKKQLPGGGGGGGVGGAGPVPRGGHAKKQRPHGSEKAMQLLQKELDRHKK